MSALLRLLVFLLVVAVPRAALATVYNNRVCVDVDIQFDDDDFGTRWTDDTVNKPGRGFWVEVTHGTFPNVVVDWPPGGVDHYVDTTGTYAGCTDDIAFDSGTSYKIVVKSEAKVDDVTLVALDDSTPAVEAVSTWNGYTPVADIDVAMVMSGSDGRWNLLALDAFALTLHNPTSGALTWELRTRSCPGGSGSCASEANATISYATSTDKFIGTHELGHMVGYAVDAGGNGCQGNKTSEMHGCDGNTNTPVNAHNFLTKEFQGGAACEAIGDFYAAITFNALTDPCELAAGVMDFNLDNTDEADDDFPFACFGDPSSASPDPVTDGDWLQDLIAADDDDTEMVQCEGTDVHRSTEYDWVRYLWGMVTEESVPLNDLWEIWDAADPHDWVGDATGTTGDFPNERMETAADDHPNNYGAEHDDQKVHGLDH